MKRASSSTPRAHKAPTHAKRTVRQPTRKVVSRGAPRVSHMTTPNRSISVTAVSSMPSRHIAPSHKMSTSFSSTASLFRSIAPVVQNHRLMSGWGYTNYLGAEEVEPRILAVLQNLPAIDVKKINNKAHFTKDLGLDSLQQVELIMLFEQEFNVEIDDNHAILIESVPEAVHYFTHTPYAV